MIKKLRARGAWPWKSERGAAAPLIAVVALSLLGVSALSIDMGNNWQHQRSVEGAVDAAALAAAESYAYGGDGCGGAAADFLARNRADATLVSCTSSGDDLFGWVTVHAKVEVDQLFGKTLGVDTATITAERSAMWGAPVIAAAVTIGTGMRPMAVCLDTLLANDDYLAWIAAGSGDSVPIKIFFTKESPDACDSSGSGVPGNWGMIDFNGGSNSNSDTKDWVENGYGGVVTTGSFQGDPGALSGSNSGGLGDLADSGETFAIPVYSNATGNGANATFELTEFPLVRLTGYKVSGKASQRHIELVFVDRSSIPIPPNSPCCADPRVGALTDLRDTRLTTLDDTGNPVRR